MVEAKALFDDAQKARVAEAIRRAEKGTSAEIIPVVATASGRYDRAEDMFGVLFALAVCAGLFVAVDGSQLFASAAPAWGAQNSGVEHSGVQSGLPAWAYLIVGLIAFGIGVVLASRLTFLRTPFVAASEMRQEVERRANEAFYRFRLRATDGATGVLVFVSLYEHRVRVLGDDAVAAKFDDADWAAICDEIIAGIRAGDMTLGLCNGIGALGEKLTAALPIAADDENELANELMFMRAP